MFEGDDDLSFVDDVFLQDVYPASATRNVMHKENDKDMHISAVKPSHSLPNSFSSKYQRGDAVCKTENSRKHLISEKGSKLKITSEFEADDDFPFDSIELDDCDTHPSPALTTPPSSVINQGSASTFCGGDMIEKGDLVGVNGKSNSIKQSDFRSKILQTLTKKKSEQSLASLVVHNHNTESLSTLRSSERLFTSDTAISKGFSSGDYRDNITDQDPKYHDRPDNWRLPHQNIESNPARTVRPPRDGDIARHEEFPRPSVTPVKARIPSKRRTVSPGEPVVQKRRFPGPAGLLPQPGFQSDMLVTPEPDDDSSSIASRMNQTIVCSQTSANSFTKGPWQQMIKDLDFDPDDPTSPVRVFTIKWVLRRAGLRGQAAVRKVPFLAVLIGSIDETRTDPTVVLRDQTGEIKGTVASSVMNEFSDALQIGSVMVLRGVTVLSPAGLRSVAVSSENTRRYYLNITPNTVLSIYTPDTTGHIITTSLGSIDLRELREQALSPTTAAGPKVIVEEEEDERLKEHSSYNNSNSLFSNLHDSITNSPGQGKVNNMQRNGTARQFGNFNNVQRGGQITLINHSPMYPLGSYNNINRSNTVRPTGNVSNMQRSSAVYSPGNVGNILRTNTVRPLGNVSNIQLRTDTVHSPGNFSEVQRNNITCPPRSVSNVQRNSQQQYQFTNVNHRPKQAVPSSRPQSSHGPAFSKPLPSQATPSSAKPTPTNREVGEPLSNSKIYSSQAEEKEVNELLSGLDADSFFEDF